MSSKAYSWAGEHTFEISGSGLHEDTLRIVQNYRQSERMLELILPTLCITYADMSFQNAVGGLQRNYPASAAYGPAYFDPPVVLTGNDIEKFTYIRGAHRVEIGPDKTIIEFPCWKDLVIPRLRIDQSPGAGAMLAVGESQIDVKTPLKIYVKQYADGRHVGGVTIEKRHPDFTPPELKPVYDVWIRVIDGVTGDPLPETMVELWRWDRGVGTPYGPGDFVLDGHHYTNGHGVVELHDLQAQGVQWYTVSKPGWRVAPRCLRPLPQQPVRLHMRAWRMRGDRFRYRWQAHDMLDELAQLTHIDVPEILQMNRIASASQIRLGMEITLPCYQGTYRPESWEKLGDVAVRFGFKDVKALADSSGLRDIKAYRAAVDLKLPQWLFFIARARDSLKAFDRQFGLPARSTRPAHRVYRPREGALLPGEVVAVPTARFAEILAGRRNP
jgi:hypothetical protein